MTNLEEEESRVKSLQEKLEKSIKTIESDLEREKSISLDSDLNEKRISKEKEELLNTENSLLQVEANSSRELRESKGQLDTLQSQLDTMLDQIEKDIDEDRKLSKERFQDLRQLVKSITSSQEDYAEKFGKDKSIQSDSIKRKERIKNIDVELENWRSLKSNSEKMISELTDRKNKLLAEINENQKNPERIATSKGQNLQNLENTKRRNEEIENELIEAEKKYNLINQNIKEIQSKLSDLKENKARNEATIEGIENRKKDLLYSVKSELNIDNENSILSQSDLNNVSPENLPSLEDQTQKTEKIKKQRESLGSVNLRADEETKKYETEIKKMEDDALKAQIFGCWSIPLGLPYDENLLVRIKLKLKPDGSVTKTEILDHARMNKPGQGFYKVLAESALRAVRLCQPLRVPASGYDRWKELQLNFDAREMLGG